MNAYIVYDLDDWPKIPLNSFKIKFALFGATNIINVVIKKSGCIVAMEWHLMRQVHEILVMAMLRML